MENFPETEKKVKSTISRYRSSLKKEYEKFGAYRDGSGKRYLLFWLYFVLNDLKKAKEYIEWYEKEFSDDIGEPLQKLCWALLLYRLGEEKEAKYRIADTMLSNLYLIPYLLGEKMGPYQFMHFTNFAEIGYLEYLPEEVFEHITDDEKKWIEKTYYFADISTIRDRYIEICKELDVTRDMEKRQRLIAEEENLLNKLK